MYDCRKTQMMELKKSLEGKLSMLENNLHLLTEKGESSPKVELTEKEHEEFMKEITRTNKQLQLQKEERRKQEERKLQEREDEHKRKEDAQRLERERRKKEQIEQKLKKLNEIKDRRQQEIDAQNRALSSLMQSKPLYEKIEEKHYQLQAQSLEEKKRKLAEIRSLHKPITKQQMEEHEKKVQAIREKKQQEREERKGDMSSDRPKAQVYKSQWYKKVLQDTKAEDKIRKDSDQVEHEQARQLRDKLRQYGDYVKSNFKPEIDPQKASELKGKEEKPQIKPQQARKMGLENLRYSKEHINPKASSPSELNSTNGNIRPPKPINYLEELKRQRVASSPANDRQLLQNLLNKPMDEQQKARKLLQHVTKLQAAAKRKQQMARSSNQPIDQQLDELYMNAAKAKLALLN